MSVTWNPSDKGSITLSNGNLTAANSSGATLASVRATVGKKTGKWYWEILLVSTPNYCWNGISMLLTPVNNSNFPYSYPCHWDFDNGAAKKRNNNVATSYGVTLTTNDVLCVAMDCDNGRLWFGKNGTWMASGDPANNTSPTFEIGPGTLYYPMLTTYGSGSSVSATARFASGSWGYSAPSGFSALDDTSDYALTCPGYKPVGHASQFGGNHRIRGTLSEDGAAGQRRAQLIDRATAVILNEAWSALDGSYAFNNIRYQYQGYTVIEYDHGDNPKNAAIADRATPEPIP